MRKKVLFIHFQGPAVGVEYTSLFFSTPLLHPSPFLLHPSIPLLLRGVFFFSTRCRPGEEWKSGEGERKVRICWSVQDRGTMAALHASLKSWVVLQTLCLALAQVVSARGKCSAQASFPSQQFVEKVPPMKPEWTLEWFSRFLCVHDLALEHGCDRFGYFKTASCYGDKEKWTLLHGFSKRRVHVEDMDFYICVFIFTLFYFL